MRSERRWERGPKIEKEGNVKEEAEEGGAKRKRTRTRGKQKNVKEKKA